MMRLRKYKATKPKGEFKVIILFHSVHDTLFNSDGSGVTKADYDKFLIDLTIGYEFDYV